MGRQQNELPNPLRLDVEPEAGRRAKASESGSDVQDEVRSRPVRLVLLAASPVYYQAPLYRRLARNPLLEFTAVFASMAGIVPHDPGYGREIVWDIDALGGYEHIFLRRSRGKRIDRGTLALNHDIIGAIRRLEPDVLWLHGYNSMTHVLAAATQHLRRGCLLFREEQTLLHPRPFWKAAAKQVLLRMMFRNAGALYIGSNNRDWLAHHGIARSRMFFAPYCVDNEQFREQAVRLKRDLAAVRRSFGIAAEDGPVIATVGRLIPKKQPLLLLEAFRRVRATHACTLLVAGSGSLEEEFRTQVERDRIPNVVMAGFMNQSEIARAYAAADIFALASNVHETWGLVVNEAMNFSLPLVLSDCVGSARDLLVENVNGFVVEASDINQWVDRLTALVEDESLRTRMGSASLKRILPWNYDEVERGVLSAVAALARRPEIMPHGTFGRSENETSESLSPEDRLPSQAGRGPTSCLPPMYEEG